MKKLAFVIPIVAVLALVGIMMFLYNPINEEKKARECFKELSPKGDPATNICNCMGHKYEINETPRGQQGICIVGFNKVDEWDYYCELVDKYSIESGCQNAKCEIC